MSKINTYGFPFTSVAGDRQYGAEDWRTYFQSLCSSGVVIGVGNQLAVSQSTTPANTVKIDLGAILVNGAMFYSDQTRTAIFNVNTSGLTRIDRVVARFDATSRLIEFAVIEGTPAVSPTPPALTRTSTIYEMSLAKVTLANGYTQILNANITDERSDLNVCGYATFAYNSILKTTKNRFFRGSNLSVTGGVETEWNWSSVSDSSNTKVYLSSNRIYLHSSVKMAWLYLNLYTSTTAGNTYVKYPSTETSVSWQMRGMYGSGASGNANICVPLMGTGVTNDIKISVYDVSGFTVYYDNYWTFAEVVALYQ